MKPQTTEENLIANFNNTVIGLFKSALPNILRNFADNNQQNDVSDDQLNSELQSQYEHFLKESPEVKKEIDSLFNAPQLKAAVGNKAKNGQILGLFNSAQDIEIKLDRSLLGDVYDQISSMLHPRAPKDRLGEGMEQKAGNAFKHNPAFPRESEPARRANQNSNARVSQGEIQPNMTIAANRAENQNKQEHKLRFSPKMPAPSRKIETPRLTR